MSDRSLRGGARDLALDPGDPDAWARLSREHERRGRADDALEHALRGHWLHPEHDGLRARLDELRSEGPWPMARANPAGTRRAVLPGPQEGVQRWRLEFDREAPELDGWPLVGRDGSVYVTALPQGVLRLPHGGGPFETLRCDTVPPALLRGRAPAVYDPALGGLTTLPTDGGVRELWLGLVDERGRTYGVGPRELVAVGPDGLRLWSNRSGLRSVASRGEFLYATATTLGTPIFYSMWSVVRLDPESGEVLHTFHRTSMEDALQAQGGAHLEWSAWLPLRSIAVAHDGSVVAGYTPDIARYSPDGEAIWTRRAAASGAPAVGAEQVVYPAAQGVTCLDLATGQPRWHREELRSASEVALDVRGHTYAAGYGWFAAIAPDGELLFRLTLPHTGAPGPISIGYEHTAFFTMGRELIAVR